MTAHAAPNDDAVLLQTAMQNIEALHHTTTQAITGFESLFTAHGQTAGADQRVAAPAQAQAGGVLQDALTELHNLATQLTAELTQTLGQAVDGLHQNTTQVQSATQQHAQDWTQAHDTLKSALASLDQSLTQGTATAVSTFGELQQTVQQVAQTSQDLLHQFDTGAQSFQRALADTVSSNLTKASGDFHDGIAGALHGKVTDHLASTFQNAEQSLNDLAQSAEHVAQAHAQLIEEEMKQFAQMVQEHTKNEIAQVADHLAKDALEALSAFIATSIAEATAGSAITGAMSPILPEVIVVKEASEAIKDLISVFKAVGSLL